MSVQGMSRLLLGDIRKLIRKLGIDVARYQSSPTTQGLPADFDRRFPPLWEQVRPYTMTSPERGYALYKAIRHLVHHGISGAIVECGVWRGGSMMLAALTLIDVSDTTRELYLFDTFAGMSDPSPVDRRAHDGALAADLLRKTHHSDALHAVAPLQDVQERIASTHYPLERIHFVQGRVEETVPESAPERIALLRLDTDWYESTKHELVHLTPRLVDDGVLIIDDYGHWLGARKAVDEYLDEITLPVLLSRIDYGGRIAVMPRLSHPAQTSQAATSHGL